MLSFESNLPEPRRPAGFWDNFMRRFKGSKAARQEIRQAADRYLVGEVLTESEVASIRRDVDISDGRIRGHFYLQDEAGRFGAITKSKALDRIDQLNHQRANVANAGLQRIGELLKRNEGNLAADRIADDLVRELELDIRGREIP